MTTSTSAATWELERRAAGEALHRSRRQRSALLRLLRYLPPHRKYAVLTVCFGTLGFLLSFVYPWLIGSAIDLVAAGSAGLPLALRHARLLELTGLAAITGCLHAIVLYGRGHYNACLSEAIVRDLRRQVFDHLQRLSMAFYARQRTGALMQRLLHDVYSGTAIIYGGIIVAGLDALQLMMAAVLLTHISYRLTLACACVFPLYGVVFVIMNSRVRKAAERTQRHFAVLSGNVGERLAGQALIKTYTAERREGERFSGEVSEHQRLALAESHHGHIVVSMGELLVHMGTTIVIGYGGWLALDHQLTPGLLTRFLGYVVILFGPVRRVAELNTTYQSSLSALRRALDVLDIEPSVADAPRALEQPPQRGEVQIEQVSFRFDAAGDASLRLEAEGEQERVSLDAPWVLDNVNLYVRPAERVAIVGHSGAGKTTLANLLPRLHDATRGRVLIDGVDVRKYKLSALRSAIAIVQQESFIFSGTVLENIAYGRPEATFEEVRAAAQAAYADEFINELAEGYSTLLGERGVNLSGGQRQRISIARALLKDPRILILDEATSSLDAESESIVQAALETLMENRTCFIIAHRLSTIRNAARIVVLEKGRVVENGTHAELMDRHGVYRRLVDKQALP